MRCSMMHWLSQLCCCVVMGVCLFPAVSPCRGGEPPSAPTWKPLAAVPEKAGATAPRQIDGLQGKAWEFDGKDDSLQMAIDGPAESTANLTVACWIKLDNRLGGASHTILSWDGKDGLERRLFVVRPALKGLAYRLGFSDGKKTYTTNGPGITAGLWYHVALTAGDGTVAFYLDGVPFDEQKAEGLAPAEFTSGRLGLDKSGEAPFAGAIEAIEVAAHVVSREQIVDLHRKQLGAVRIEANRKQLLEDFPDAEQQLDDAESKWSRVLSAPYWYGKAWSRNEAWNWPEYEGKAVIVIAAADSPDQEGAQVRCDGTTDDIPIQRALDALPESGGKVILREGTYRLTNVLMPKSHTELEIHGTLVVADAVTSKLTQDATTDDNTFHVAEAAKFRAGQWVTVVDKNKINHKGGWENPKGGRKYGECAPIKAVKDNQLILEGAFNQYENWGNWRTRPEYRDHYLVEAGAFVTTSHSAILVQGQSFVYIHGPGAICGNRENQSPTAPLSTWQRWEEMRADSGIVVCDSSFVRIEGLTVRNANLHNVTFWMAENCEATGLEAFGSNDKNIVSVKTSRLRLIDNHTHDAVQEDGIIFYSAGHLQLVGKNRIIGNPRLGLHVNANCRFVTSIRNIMQGNGRNMTLKEGDERQSFSIEDIVGE